MSGPGIPARHHTVTTKGRCVRRLGAGLAALCVLACDRPDDRSARQGLTAARGPAPLRVCADPNNLPFSDSTGAGFENRLAQLVAAELRTRVAYTWWAQRRGFIRSTLDAHECDVVMGVPTSFERTAVTRPYYRSSYVFVTRRDRRLRLRSFDDPALHRLTVGVQLIGDDYANAPPAHALARRGIVRNVRGYAVYGDYRQPSPPAGIVHAVARGDVDVAVVWGPLAGYFATREPVALDLVPVSPQVDRPFLPFVFDISMGVRRADRTLRDTLDAILLRRHASVDSLLQSYGVPLLRPRNGESVIAAPGENIGTGPPVVAGDRHAAVHRAEGSEAP